MVASLHPPQVSETSFNLDLLHFPKGNILLPKCIKLKVSSVLNPLFSQFFCFAKHPDICKNTPSVSAHCWPDPIIAQISKKSSGIKK